MTNFLPLVIKIDDKNHIQTPFGYLPEDWVWDNLLTMGLQKGDMDWYIIKEEHGGKTITLRYNNFWIALKKSMAEVNKKTIDLEVLNLAKAKKYEDRYLPNEMGFSSYSTLMNYYKC